MALILTKLHSFQDDSGAPYVNGSMYVGEFGQDPLTNPVSIWADEDETIPLANPQATDAYGVVENPIYISSDYSYAFYDEFSALVYGPFDIRNGGSVATSLSSGSQLIQCFEVTTDNYKTDLGISAIPDAGVYELLFLTVNTGATTLQWDELPQGGATQYPVYKMDGPTDTWVELEDNDISVDVPIRAHFDSVSFNLLPYTELNPENLITYTGSGDYTKPAELKSVEITVIGGGAGGSSEGPGAAGGGAGGYVRGLYKASELEDTEAIVVGAGGASRNTLGEGNPGGTSSFGGAGSVVLSATGGNTVEERRAGVGTGGQINGGLGAGQLDAGGYSGMGGGPGGGEGSEGGGLDGGDGTLPGAGGGGTNNNDSGAGGDGIVTIREIF